MRDLRLIVGGRLDRVFGGQAMDLAGARRPGQALDFDQFFASTTADGSANTKGTYTQNGGGTLADDCYGLDIKFPNANFARDTLVDIAIGGAGSEVVVINNVLCSAPKSAQRLPVAALFPIFIPKGTRIASRCQSSVASNTQEVWLTPFYTNPWPRIYRTIETYGAATGDSGGTSIDPGGSANTEGAWVQLTAATTRRVRLLTLLLGQQANQVRTTCTWRLNIAIGASGSEVKIVGDLWFNATDVQDVVQPICWPNLPVDIPAGSRVSANAQCSITDATDRLFDLAAYGAAP